MPGHVSMALRRFSPSAVVPVQVRLDCAIRLAEQYEFIYATIGIHPHEANLATDADFSELELLAKRPKVIAWGEIGLDYFYDHSPRDLQRQVFLETNGDWREQPSCQS